MSKASILIVEDEHIVAMDVQNSLERNDYQAAGHTDRGEIAIKLAEELRPHLILMDISLKGEMDGIEAAIQIGTRLHIPIIFLTAFANQSTTDRARMAEPYGYLLKPFEERELVITIEMALYKHNMEIKLRESEDKFRSVVKHASDGIILIDGQGKIIEWNAAMEQITGLESVAVIGQPAADVIFRLLPEEKRTIEIQEANAKAWKTAIKEGFPNVDQMAEYEIESLQGERRTVQSSGFAMEISLGMMAGLIMRDITEKKRMTDALVRSEAQLQIQKIELEMQNEQLIHTHAELEDSRARYLDLYELAPVGYLMLDQKGVILESNLTAANLFGADRDKIAQQLLGHFILPEDQDIFYLSRIHLLETGAPQRCEFRMLRSDRSAFWVQLEMTITKGTDGTPLCRVALSDVTQRKQAELAERDQHQLAESLRDTAMILSSSLSLDDVLDRILDNIWKLVEYDTAMVSLIEGDAIQKIRYQKNPQKVSNSMTLGDIQANLLNIPILRTIIDTKQPQLIPDMQEDQRWQTVATMPGMNRIRSLVCVPVEIHENVAGVINILSTSPNYFTPLHIERIKAFASQAAVAMENAQLYEQAKRLSITDPLTELFNMRYFMDFGKLEFERVRRYARTLSVVMLDIDHFKIINDMHGHNIGDQALREISNRIKDSVRAVDVVARYGGEEFIVLMPETGQEEAVQVAERIRQSIADIPIKNGNITISITISLGVAEINKNTNSLEELIKYADQTLYRAKDKGRNRVELYSTSG